MPAKDYPRKVPPQSQEGLPGRETEMTPKPFSASEGYKGSGKLNGQIAVITGGDSGIGRAVAVLFAKEGADVAILYKEEHQDAEETRQVVEKQGRRCLLMSGDVADPKYCHSSVAKALKEWQRLDILVNNAAVQYPQDSIEKISEKQLEETFRTNIFAYFYMAQSCLPHLKAGSAIINTTSVTAYKGSKELIDYSSTKGAIVSFTRSLALSVVERGIRVNAVAPGPIWTPLIPASFEEEKVAKFGESAAMKRPGQPEEVAPCYLFLASSDSSYMTGQVLHPNGGTIING